MSNNQKSTSKFYDHEKLGCIPVDWDAVRLGKDFDFFPTATFSRSQLSDSESCLYIHYGDIHTRFERFIDLDKYDLPSISLDMARKYTPIHEGDLIISDASEDYEGVGKAVEIVNVSNKIIIAGLHTLHLRVKNDEFIKGFKGYILNQEKVRNSILRIATGIKVYSISKSQLKKIFLPKPPKKEQIEITKILSLVDEAITATQNSINKAERLKKSLMQNLLTGKLKPDGTLRIEDEFYKDEKFGNVPIGWIIKKGNKLTNKITKGQSPKWQGFQYQSDGTLFVTSENVLEGRIDVSSPKYLPNEFNQKMKGSQLQKGDILINIVGASIGRCAVFNLDMEKANTNQAVCIFRPNDENDSSFLAYYIQWSQTQYRLLGNQVETARANLSLGDFRKFKFVIPESKDEQIEISESIEKIDTVLQSKQDKINKLERLKKALMQNLLTGKLRIKM